MPIKLDLLFDRPTCPCGRRTWVNGQGSGLFKRSGLFEKGDWFRFACRLYRQGSADDHFHGVADSKGRPVELLRRKPRDPIKGRPRCSECRELLTAHGFKETSQGKGRYFVCTKPDCNAQGAYQLHYEKDGRWRLAKPARGPKPRDFGVDKCPACKRRSTLRSRGLFKSTRDYRQRLQRVVCQHCRATFRLVEYGKLEKAPSPGFQRKHDPPTCPVHGCAMKRGTTYRQGAIRVYRWRCSRSGCQRSVLLDGHGRPASSDQTRVEVVRAKPRRCAMLGCREVRVDQVDGRKRYCVSHSKLSYFQRWRVKRDRRAAITREGQLVLVGTARTATAAATEFGGWLAAELGLRGETHRSAARKTGIPWKTIYNWLAGISMPAEGDPQLLRLVQTFGIDPNGFAVRLATA